MTYNHSCIRAVGGKLALLDKILPLIPKHKVYVEPFLGSGVVFLNQEHDKDKLFILNDINKYFINIFKIFKHSILTEELLYECKRLQDQYLELSTDEECSDKYYSVRNWLNMNRNKQIFDDKHIRYIPRKQLLMAVYTMFLNKLSFNAIWRSNRRGEFNSPFGHKIKKSFYNEDVIKSLVDIINNSQTEITSLDYRFIDIPDVDGVFIYLDPPYAKLNKNTFTYNQDFSLHDFHAWCEIQSEKGHKLLISQANTPEVVELFKGWNYDIISAKRQINSNKSGRNPKNNELLLYNYNYKIDPDDITITSNIWI